MCVAVLLGVIGGCGPSATQIKVARSAEYGLTGHQLLDMALQVAQQTYKVGAIDTETLKFATTPQWYSAEGGRISPTNEGGGDYVNAGDRDVQVTLIVEIIVLDKTRTMVTVTPKTFQLIGGSPQPRELAPTDPNLPGWVLGRADALAVKIYEAGKPHLVPAGHPAPGGSSAPGATPIAPPPASS